MKHRKYYPYICSSILLACLLWSPTVLADEDASGTTALPMSQDIEPPQQITDFSPQVTSQNDGAVKTTEKKRRPRSRESSHFNRRKSFEEPSI